MRVKIAIVGAGGHGVVVADILQRMREAGDRIDVVAFVDDEPSPGVSALLSVRVYAGGLKALRVLAYDAVIVAIGNNDIRCRICDTLRRSGTLLAIARHPSSVVAPDVDTGPGTVICAGAIVNPGTRIGVGAIVNTRASVDHHSTIGDYAHIAPGACLGGNVTVGDLTLIGIGSTLIPGTRIGARVVVGAGSVVTRELPDGVMAYGAPARIRTPSGRPGSRYALPGR
jgi:sugar O-acyltransferase (sialic acid O-acetyltransferase NeuD family)